MRFKLNCSVTGRQEVLSGELHVEVRRQDGSTFWLDPAFWFCLQNINDPNVEDWLCTRFSATRREARAVLMAIVRTRLVVESNEAEDKTVDDAGGRRLKVGILTERMKLGYGVDLVVDQTARGLAHRGMEVVVFAGSVEPIYQSVPYQMVSLQQETGMGDVFSQSFFRRSIGLIRDAGCDVWLVESLPFYYWLEHLPGPVVVVEHGTPYPELFAGDLSLAVRIARLLKRERVFKRLRSCDRIVAVSQFLASELPKEVAGVATVIYNGCDHYARIDKEQCRAFREELGVAPSDMLLVFVGRIDFDQTRQPYKRVDELIASWQRLNARLPAAKLLLVGRSDTLTKGELAQTGAIPILNAPPETVARALASSDLFVSMSRWEGFDLPLCEAQFQGTPCVAFRCGAHPELIDGTGAGVLVDSEEEFERAVEALYNDRVRLASMSQRAMENSRRFTWHRNVEMMEAVIRDALGASQLPVFPIARHGAGRAKLMAMLGLEVLRNEGVVSFIRLAGSKAKRVLGASVGLSGREGDRQA